MKPEIVLTKQEVTWYLADKLVQSLMELSAYRLDETFKRTVDGLKSYITEKLALCGNGEVIDYFVLVLQKAGE